ncbi:hypothetical protein ACHWQZ_G001993 [Mnemiopsis leidyi]
MIDVNVLQQDSGYNVQVPYYEIEHSTTATQQPHNMMHYCKPIERTQTSPVQPCLRFRRSRRKYQSPDEVNTKRLAVNSRQRTRMKIMNTAYEKLTEVLPALPEKRKPTKLETLQLAIQYLRHLTLVLEQNGY